LALGVAGQGAPGAIPREQNAKLFAVAQTPIPSPRLPFVWPPGGGSPAFGRQPRWAAHRWAEARPGQHWAPERWEQRGKKQHFEPGRLKRNRRGDNNGMPARGNGGNGGGNNRRW